MESERPSKSAPDRARLDLSVISASPECLNRIPGWDGKSSVEFECRSAYNQFRGHSHQKVKAYRLTTLHLWLR